MAAQILRFGSGQRLADVVTPTAQASTNSEVLVTGSELDLSLFDKVSYTLENSGAQTILISVYRANLADFSDESQDGSDISIAAAAFALYTDNPAPLRFYRLKVQAAVGDAQGEITAAGVAK